MNMNAASHGKEAGHGLTCFQSSNLFSSRPLLSSPTCLQFELDIEPKVFFKPSRVSGTKAPAPNGSQEFSFSGEPAPKGMGPLSETVSKFEMLAKAGKDTMGLPYLPLLHPSPHIFPFPFFFSRLALAILLSPPHQPGYNTLPALMQLPCCVLKSLLCLGFNGP